MLTTQLLQILLQQCPHLYNPFRHRLHLSQPLLIKFWVLQNLRCNARAVDGGVGVEWADEDFDLRVYAFFLLGGGAANGEGADALAVEALDWDIVS